MKLRAAGIKFWIASSESKSSFGLQVGFIPRGREAPVPSHTGSSAHWLGQFCSLDGWQVQLAGIGCTFHEKFHPISKMICVPNNSEKGNPDFSADFSSSSPFPKNHPSWLLFCLISEPRLTPLFQEEDNHQRLLMGLVSFLCAVRVLRNHRIQEKGKG